MKLKVRPASVTTQWLFSTTRITSVLEDFSEATGTGFFFRAEDKDFLITNKHVIDNAKLVKFPIHLEASGSPLYVKLGHYEIVITSFKDWIYHPDENIDLCCIPVDKIQSKAETFFYYPLKINQTKELASFPASIGVSMVGYPNGLWDEKNGLPIIRRGNTASPPGVPYNSNSEIVLDMACFPGSSGSPVMIYEPSYSGSSDYFLGVLYAGPTISSQGELLVTKIPTSKEHKLSVQTMMHLGFVITADKVIELVEHVVNEITT